MVATCLLTWLVSSAGEPFRPNISLNTALTSGHVPLPHHKYRYRAWLLTCIGVVAALHFLRSSLRRPLPRSFDFCWQAPVHARRRGGGIIWLPVWPADVGRWSARIAGTILTALPGCANEGISRLEVAPQYFTGVAGSVLFTTTAY